MDPTRSEPSPGRGDRGASLVEYSLAFVFIVVATLGAARYLTTQGRTEVRNQADCVSQRPPPPSCQIRVATPTTSTTTVGVTTTTAGPITSSTSSTSTSTPPTTATRPPATPTVNNTGRPGTYKGVSTTVTVRSGTAVVPNAEVRFQYDAIAPGGSVSFEVVCRTNASGTCTAEFDSPYTDTTSIRVTVIEITSNPPAGTLPPAQTVVFP